MAELMGEAAIGQVGEAATDLQQAGHQGAEGRRDHDHH
jgi:hypothetical protein